MHDIYIFQNVIFFKEGDFYKEVHKILTNLHFNRPYPVIWKIVPIRINILKLRQVNFCIENITLSKFQGDTSNSFPDIAFRIYINSYGKLAICTWVGTKYCILPTLNQRVLYLKHCNYNQIQYSWMKLGMDMSQ